MHTVILHKPIHLHQQPTYMVPEHPIHMVSKLLMHLDINLPIILVDTVASITIANSVSMISKACTVISMVPMAETEATADMADRAATIAMIAG